VNAEVRTARQSSYYYYYFFGGVLLRGRGSIRDLIDFFFPKVVCVLFKSS
jgi:hypothetical protein